MNLADQVDETGAGVSPDSKLICFGIIKDDYYYYLGEGQDRLGVVNHNQEHNKWKLCHMVFLENAVLAEFSRDAKFFLCAVGSKGPEQKVTDLRCFKDGVSNKIDFGGSNEHLFIHGMNTKLGFRTLFDVTLFATQNNMIIMLFNLAGDGTFDRIIKLNNKFIKESISDISILTRGSFIVLGSKGYLGLYKKKLTAENELRPEK